jgi:hypothetical protein
VVLDKKVRDEYVQKRDMVATKMTPRHRSSRRSRGVVPPEAPQVASQKEIGGGPKLGPDSPRRARKAHKEKERAPLARPFCDPVLAKLTA